MARPPAAPLVCEPPLAWVSPSAIDAADAALPAGVVLRVREFVAGAALAPIVHFELDPRARALVEAVYRGF